MIPIVGTIIIAVIIVNHLFRQTHAYSALKAFSISNLMSLRLKYHWILIEVGKIDATSKKEKEPSRVIIMYSG